MASICMVLLFASLAASREPSCTGHFEDVGFLQLPTINTASATSLTGSSLLHEGASAEAATDRARREVVWISAFARSGSSTLMEMVKAAGSDDPLQVYSLFEPSHNQRYEADQQLASEPKANLLANLMRCDFDGIESLWDGPGTYEWSSAVSGDNCSSSDLLVIKTVNFGHHLDASVLQMLESNPSLRILSVVRDPRAIYASQKLTSGHFKQESLGILGMLSICDAFAANLEVKHERLLFTVFEHMTNDPMRYAQQVYDFLKLPVNSAQVDWINNNFNAQCKSLWQNAWDFIGSIIGRTPPMDSYTTCRTNSAASNQKWRHDLDNSELIAFERHDSCVKVAETFGYPLNVAAEE